MAVLAAGCMVVLAEQATVFGVALLWFLFSAFQNGEYATLSAAIPDHVPVRQRATVSGWVGMPIALGLVLGTVLVVDVLDQPGGQDRRARGPDVLLALPFVLFTPDYPLAPHDREPFSWRGWPRPTGSARGVPGFGWAWLTRFLTSLAIAMGTLYLLYFLRDAVHYARLFPGQDRGGRPAHPDPDLHRLRRAGLDRRRGDLRTAGAAARCWSPCPAC